MARRMANTFRTARGEIYSATVSAPLDYSVPLRARRIAGDQLAIERVGEFVLEGEPVVRYNFQALPSTAGWMVSYGRESGSAREAGWFLVDSKNLVLRRVFVKAANIPSNLKLTNLSALIDYESETIGDYRVLLPSIARVEVGERAGLRRASIISFDHCRSFTADSTLSFPTTDPKEASKSMTKPVRLPVGVEVAVSINSPLSPSSAEENDVLTATVARSVILNGHELIESGAVIEGHNRPKRGKNAVIIQFDRVHTRLGWAPFYAQLVSISGSPEAHVRGGNSDQQTAQSLRAADDYVELTEPEIPGVATITFSSKAAEVPTGAQMIWKTEPLLVAPKDALVPQMSTSMEMK